MLTLLQNTLHILYASKKLVEELQKIHNNKYNYVQHKVWAKMIKSGQWSDKETPQN